MIGGIALPRRIPRKSLCRAHANAYPHRDPRCGRDRRRRDDELRGGARLALGASFKCACRLSRSAMSVVGSRADIIPMRRSVTQLFSNDAMISALFEQQVDQCTLWRTGGA